MPDNNNRGRTSNKAMTFFVCFLAPHRGLLFGLGYRRDCRRSSFIADEFQINAHTGNGGPAP